MNLIFSVFFQEKKRKEKFSVCSWAKTLGQNTFSLRTIWLFWGLVGWLDSWLLSYYTRKIGIFSVSTESFISPHVHLLCIIILLKFEKKKVNYGICMMKMYNFCLQTVMSYQIPQFNLCQVEIWPGIMACTGLATLANALMHVILREIIWIASIWA